MQNELETPVYMTLEEAEADARRIMEKVHADREERWRTVIQPKLIDLARRGAQEGLEKLAADDCCDGRDDAAKFLLADPAPYEPALWVAAWAEPDVWEEQGKQREDYATLWVLPSSMHEMYLTAVLANYGGDEYAAIDIADEDGESYQWLRIWWD